MKWQWGTRPTGSETESAWWHRSRADAFAAADRFGDEVVRRRPGGKLETFSPGRVTWRMTRHHLAGRHYPSYAPKILWHRVKHHLFGPLLGCSCSRCFDSRWRIVPASEIYRDRVRIANIEDTLRDAGRTLRK